MRHQVKHDWVINNQNIFGFEKGVDLSFSSIQYEISNQINNKAINSISDYLGSDIDITKEIQLTESLSIKRIFEEFLGFDNTDPLEQKTVKCYLVLSYLQLCLFKEYTENNHNNILTYSEYEINYNKLLNSFLSSNIDTDEKDFIKEQEAICDALIKELNKPIYNLISPFYEVLNMPCNFKKNLTNSIDKRLKYLRIKQEQTNKNLPNKKYLITNQSLTCNRRTSKYVVSENEISHLRHHIKSEHLDRYIKSKTEDEKGNYVITSKREIDRKINLALKRDYNFFNEANKNYRQVTFDNIGIIEVFKIDEVEYLIEGNETEKHKFFIYVYNYGYAEKWLKNLDSLLGNFCFGTLEGIKQDIIEDAEKKGIININKFASTIESLFNHCLNFHNNKKFEGINYTTDRHILFRYINAPGGIFWWKQDNEQEFHKSFGNLFQNLEDLFISESPNKFMQIRDFINLWINKIIDITINNKTKMFQWAYSPFMDNIFSLENKIKELFSDDRIRLKNSLVNSSINDTETQPKNTESKDKPNFASSIVDEVYEIPKEHFETDEHTLLEKINELIEKKYLLQYVADYYVNEIWEEKEVKKYRLLGKNELINDIINLKRQISFNHLEYSEYFDFIQVDDYKDWYSSSENFINALLEDYELSNLHQFYYLNYLLELFYLDLIKGKKKGFDYAIIDHNQYLGMEEESNFLIVLNEITRFVSDTMRLKLYELILKQEFNEVHLKNLQQIQVNNNESENEAESNDFIKSTIEDYLEPIKKFFNEKDYELLVNELDSYFKTGAFTNSNEVVKTVNRPNKKLIGWQLKELYHASFNDNRFMDIDYLKFGKKRISIFNNASFDENQVRKSNLYKYYHSKP